MDELLNSEKDLYDHFKELFKSGKSATIDGIKLMKKIGSPKNNLEFIYEKVINLQ